MRRPALERERIFISFFSPGLITEFSTNLMILMIIFHLALLVLDR